MIHFFALAFAFTWTFWGLRALASHGLLPVKIEPMVLHILGAFGPAAAAIVLTARHAGRAGLQKLFAPLTRWRVGAGWYAFALLVRPLIWLTALGVYVLAGQRTLSWPPVDWGFFALYLTSQLLVVGIGEELGWSGFALPRLRARYGLLVSSLILGVLWGLWHLPFFLTIGDSQYGSSLLLFVVKSTAFRYLFALACTQTGSLVLPGLFHVSYNVLTEQVPLSPNDPLAIALSCALAVAVAVTRRLGLPKRPAIGNSPNTE